MKTRGAVDVDALRATAWGGLITPAQLARVAAESNLRLIAAGDAVCRKGEPVETWIGVLDGLVKITSVSPQGKTITFAGVPPGGWFGEGSLLKPGLRPYDASALRESSIAYVPRSTFNWLLDTSLPFNRFLLRQLNERLGQFIARVEHDQLLGPDARVARAVAGLFNPMLYPNNSMKLSISQEEIGYLAGVSRQRANQALQVLENAGLLRVEYGGVTVLALEKLRSFEPSVAV